MSPFATAPTEPWTRPFRAPPVFEERTNVGFVGSDGRFWIHLADAWYTGGGTGRLLTRRHENTPAPVGSRALGNGAPSERQRRCEQRCERRIRAKPGFDVHRRRPDVGEDVIE